MIPLFEKLRGRQPKFTDLSTILVLGGDPINSQFSAIHSNPDVIVATPGRFLHLCVEMDLKLSSVGKREVFFYLNFADFVPTKCSNLFHRIRRFR